MRIITFTAILLLCFSALADITGPARVVAGDTIWVGKTKILLHGIDAPEVEQTCITRKSNVQQCGQLSKQALEKLVSGQDVTCKGETLGRDKHLIAVCYRGPFNINEQMVLDGWAVAYREYSKDYVRAETFAKSREEGIWRTEFDMPWVWRKSQRRKNTKKDELRYTCHPTLAVFCHNIHVSCSGRTNIPTSIFRVLITGETAVLDFVGTPQSVSGHAASEGDLVITLNDSRAWVRIEPDGKYSHRIYPKGNAAMSYGVCDKE